MSCNHSKLHMISHTVPPPKYKLRKRRWPTIVEECNKCNERFNRKMTLDEISYYRNRWVDGWKEIEKTHKIYHTFKKRFYNEEKRCWKYSGYAFMVKARRFAKKYTEVIITGCDDSLHTGSDIILIPHYEKSGKNWGNTVVVIPQFESPPVEFFLYPEHTKELIRSLYKLR